MNSEKPLYISHAGPMLLETPLLNKASAFSKEERESFNLTGLLPDITENIEDQTARVYDQLQSFTSNIDKHVYLRNIQDTNETLYYRLVVENLEEVMPLIYTPTVGQACQQFSRIYRRHRGLFINYNDRDNIDAILHNATKRKIKVVVVTDGERILGLGDQGIGGMGIPIGKLALYSACGGISPAYTLPITLDVGTNNQQLIDDPMYMGWKHERITGKDYDDFVENFMSTVAERWPLAMVQFEDFAGHNANRILERYRDHICCFNDDIQGTAAVTVGTLLAACRSKGEALKDQVITFCGAGSAGCGIAEQIVAEIVSEGLTDREARQRIFMINSRGLMVGSMSGLKDFQLRLCQPDGLLKEWKTEGDTATLEETVEKSKSTVIIGVSTVAGLFTQSIIEQMQANNSRPIVLPLSNPTSKVEAQPQDILKWTNGKAIVATGSPFDPVELDGKRYPISQCNNSYIFPGVGLAVVAGRASRITDNMLMVASHALAEYAVVHDKNSDGLLPDLNDIRQVSRYIAKQVYRQAIKDGVASDRSDEEIEAAIAKNFWQPNYRSYKRISF
ncbi:MAG: malate dehydrogenase (oxaloacetate-decarboxylating) [Cellvibrionaceae bacterium]|jgi:malate dehydrogenase (oxaloacetate-decarboxylating)